MKSARMELVILEVFFWFSLSSFIVYNKPLVDYHFAIFEILGYCEAINYLPIFI